MRHFAVVALVISLCAAGAFAHGVPVPFAFWGDDFLPEEAICQRVIGHAGALGGTRQWRAREVCLRSTMHGQVCDTRATAAAIEDGRWLGERTDHTGLAPGAILRDRARS